MNLSTASAPPTVPECDIAVLSVPGADAPLVLPAAYSVLSSGADAIAVRAIHGSDHETLTQAARDLAAGQFPAPDACHTSYSMRVSYRRNDTAKLTVRGYPPITDGPPADANKAALLETGMAKADAMIICLPAERLIASASGGAVTEGLLTLALKVRTALSSRSAPTPVVFALTSSNPVGAASGLSTALRPIHQLLADIANMDHARPAVIGFDAAVGSLDAAAPLLWCLRHASFTSPHRAGKPVHATGRPPFPGVALKSETRRIAALNVDDLLSRTSITVLPLPAEAPGARHERT